MIKPYISNKIRFISSAEFANSAEDESNLIQNIKFNSNLCIINMDSLFGITFILYLLKLSAIFVYENLPINACVYKRCHDSVRYVAYLTLKVRYIIGLSEFQSEIPGEITS